MATILSDHGDVTVAATDGLCLSPADTESATQWTLKPEGLCRDALCVPLQPQMLREGRIDVAAFWRPSAIRSCRMTKARPGFWAPGPRIAKQRWPAPPHPTSPCPTSPECLTACPTCAAKKVFLTTWASW